MSGIGQNFSRSGRKIPLRGQLHIMDNRSYVYVHNSNYFYDGTLLEIQLMMVDWYSTLAYKFNILEQLL